MQTWYRIILWSGLSRQLPRTVKHPWREWSSLHWKIGLSCCDSGHDAAPHKNPFSSPRCKQQVSSCPSSANHCYSLTLTSCGGSSLNPNFLSSSSCTSPQQTWSSPDLWKNLYPAQGSEQWRKPLCITSFDGRSTACWECQELSLLATSDTKTFTCHF